MTDPDGTPGASRPHDDDLPGGTPAGVAPYVEEEPTVPLAAGRVLPVFPDPDGPTVNLTGRALAAPDGPMADEGRTAPPAGRVLAGPDESAAGHGRTAPPAGHALAGADGSAAGDERTVSLTGRGPADDPVVAERDGAGAAEGLTAAGADRVPAGGPEGAGGKGSASAVPPGDLDLGESVAEPRTGEPGETSDTSPDPSISGAAEGDLDRPRIRRPAPAGTLIWVLLALLGFTLVVQLRSNDADDGLAATRQEDLVRILSDLESEDSRLLAQIAGLEQSKQQLNSEVGGREAAVAEAQRRSQDLGLLAGTVAGRGPGLDITLSDVRASDVLNTVQELRGAGGEVMQLNGANGTSVRLVASSFFVDASGGGIIADGEELVGPFHLLVIGPASTMSTALQIPGGVVASAKSDGGSVTMDSRSLVEVTAVRKAAALRYARPVS
ncbi:hypothetical protein Aph02nite_05940 [Actinoplanes philippinensis]|uniref:Uncharacterized conserved protein YlxW, UPF0749 family n=1 Tax=Actinoplanes philippinensis TaxID=35752 RepID=A0A1I2CVX8_9ACTN|nr:DUF881 domain-containing protein [Actinoplanes philippinensis]GIE74644.1 hypothetical protein Aph02nite_05940 [Actinoplanes philippinensis]SFE72444.1 Uncharacterized conserved protein YlxW, UPF0749 family [Actinoplanes philippinensis]